MQRSPLTIPIAIFWFILFSAFSVIWNLAPSSLSQAGFLIIFIMALLLPLSKQMDLPVLASLFLIFSTVNFWVSIGSISHFHAITLILVMVFTVGLLTEKVLRPGLLHHEPVIKWLLLGFFSAQINSVVQYYPVTFFDHTLISLIVFYCLWLIIDQKVSDERRSLASHFVFVGLAVMVVLGSILWAHFPYLAIF